MDMSLNRLLTLSAEELTDLAVTADQLGTVGYADIERWQALDKISQHLEGIAALLKRIAEIVPPLTLDGPAVMGRLKTAALAERLAGQLVQAEAQTGEFELFGA